jgi:GH35 family endo-1,4-beta-xylanase
MKRPFKAGLVALAALACPAGAIAQTSIAGGSLGLKSNNTNILSSNGYLGTYLVVPTGGATVNLTINATAASGASAAPHMNLVIADSIAGFSVTSTSSSNYSTPNITLPAGTYFVRNERDYSGNVGVTRSFTVNNLAVSTVSGATATFSNTNLTTSNTNALTAANTYIENFRKGSATISLTGPGSIPLLAGTPISVDLARHAFNFGTEVPGNTPTDVSSYLGNNGTTLQTNYQAKLNQNFNAIVPGNAGKWQNNEFTRDVVTMSGVDTVLNYAQSHNMRARMHNLIWGDNSFNGQQPSWVLNNDGKTGLLDKALDSTLTQAQRDTAAADLRGEITERIQYYLSASRASKMVEMDVYNESYHVPQYTTALGYDSTDGIASIHNEAAAAAPSVKMFTNDYNVFQDGGDSYANWYVNEIQSIRNAGGNVGGIGAQYYPNTTIGSANNQHNAGRMYATFQNLSVQGIPIALTEFGVKAGGEAISPQVLEESLRLAFGTPNSTGFMMWGFWAGEGLFAPGSPLYDTNWNITDTGKKWQDLLGIADWNGNTADGWDTNLSLTTDSSGAISFKGFYGDYYLSGQGTGAYDLNLAKGTTNYNTPLAAPPTWSLWNSSSSGSWSSIGSWSTSGSANALGQTAYFGPAAAARTVTVDSPKTVGMLAFNSASPYTISGNATLTLAGFNNASGNVAAIYVSAGNHSITAPLAPQNDTAITIATGSSLTVSKLQDSTVMLSKRGAGVLSVNLIRAGGLSIEAGAVHILPDGGSSGISYVSSLSVAAGAVLDLEDNDLVVQNGNFSAIQNLVFTGYSGNVDTSKTGITSTAGQQAGGTTILALFDNALAGFSDYPTGSGNSIATGAIVGKYTYIGDTNMDGQVTPQDYTATDSNLGTSAPLGISWFYGDTNFDGNIDPTDYAGIDGALGLGQGNPLTDSGLASVPEPTTAAMICACGSALLTRRRRRH